MKKLMFINELFSILFILLFVSQACLADSELSAGSSEIKRTAPEISLKPVVNSSSLKDLNWLIGNWAPEIAKDKVQFKADWINENHFINCTFAITGYEGVSDVQAIGWDPVSQKPTSWNFSFSGGFGRSFWERNGENWILHAKSIQPDGSTGIASYILHKIDSDTFTWKSIKRSINGTPLPDTPEIKLVRLTNMEGH